MSPLTVPAVGRTLSYTEFNTDVVISATTAATANTVVTAPAFTANGVDSFWVVFYTPGVNVAAAVGAQIRLSLYDNGSEVVAGVSIMALWVNPASVTSLITPAPAERKVTPASGSHAYSVRGWQLSGNGQVYGTVGGLSFPGYIRILTDA